MFSSTKSCIAGALMGCFLFGLAGCKKNTFHDPGDVIIDDKGVQHRTVNYLRDKHGRRAFPKKVKSLGEKFFVFDPKIPAWAAYDADGNRMMTGRASGGADFCEDIGKPCRTITGSFRVYRKRGEDCRSSEYPIKTSGGARMPYCIYFFRGYSIHAGFGFNGGNNTSHGCIRVVPSAAKWLNESFLDIGSRVFVLSYAEEDGDGDWVTDAVDYQNRE